MIESNRLPNLRNLGVNLRILLIVNILFALATAVLSQNINGFSTLITSFSAVAQPMLLLYASYPLLAKLRYWQGLLATLCIILFACSSMYRLIAQLFIFSDLPSSARTLFFVFIVSAITLYYFYLHQRAPTHDDALETECHTNKHWVALLKNIPETIAVSRRQQHLVRAS